ncbi:MAG: adenylate/guanylate cyclase domain-containing protein [Planctomycetota bacterium]
MDEAALASALEALGAAADERERLTAGARAVLPSPHLEDATGAALRLALAAAAHPVWLGRFGPQLLATADASRELLPFERGVAAHVKALLAWRHQRDLQEALAWIEEGHAALDAAGAEGARYVGRLGDTLGQVLLHQGRFVPARRAFEEALAAKRAAGDAEGVALTLGNLARLLMAVGEFRLAQDLLREDLAFVASRPETPARIGWQLATELATCEMETGQLDAAARRLEDVRAAAHAAGERITEAFATVHAGRLALRRGEAAAARDAAAQVTALLDDAAADAWAELRGLAAHLEGQAREALGDRDGARRALDAARRWYAAAPRVTPLEQAELLEAIAWHAEADGDSRAAGEALREALHALDATGAEAFRARLDARLKETDEALWTLHASGRFMGHAELERLLDEAGRGGFRGHDAEVAVLFSDLRGFTALTERLGAETLVATLNGYFEDMTRAIEAFGGRVDKFIGDAVMAVFPAGCHADGHGVAAVRAALAMQVELARMNRHLPAGIGPLRASAGVHAGQVVAGLVGSPRKRSFTVLGDVVNTASRLEGMCKQLEAPLLVSEALVEALPDPAAWSSIPLGRFRPKGRGAAVGVHALLGRAEATDAALTARARDAAAAFALRAAGQDAAAQDAFGRLAAAPGPGRGAFVRWAAAPALRPSMASSADAVEDALQLEEK